MPRSKGFLRGNKRQALSAKATHIESARRIFWRRVTCKPVTRMRKYVEKGHALNFEDWWRIDG
eukprot:16431837-Heterocapsa_arctica.AAC.1